MDNDILWACQSFGFNTSVERATSFINTIRAEAESTRRTCIVELFGAEAGFVAANAALASGRVDLVMVPEVFEVLSRLRVEMTLKSYVEYLSTKIKNRHRTKEKNPHAVVVIAEGVAKVLAKAGARFAGSAIDKDSFPRQLAEGLSLTNMAGEVMKRFTLEPRYYIRAVPANSHDQISCKRLGALAVDNALAGYTDFMISQWLTEYVLVPLDLLAGCQKHVPSGGMFWKQVVQSTGQPVAIEARISKEASGKRTWHTSRRGEWPCVRDCCDYTRALISD